MSELEKIANELATHAPRTTRVGAFAGEPPAWALTAGVADQCGYCGSWIDAAIDACPTCRGDHMLGLAVRARRLIEKESLSRSLLLPQTA
jgi:hypothetical protein